MASDRQALLAAVCADPHDVSLRLGFADWLEQNGQPERAMFIRIEVERENLSRDDPQATALRDEMTPSDCLLCHKLDHAATVDFRVTFHGPLVRKV